MDSLLVKIVNTLTGDKAAAAQSGKDYWVDDSKVKACYECETPFSVFVRRHHCRICGRIFCSNCTITSISAPKDAPDQAWLRVCNYCHRMRQRDDDSSERGQSGTAEQLLLGSVAAAAASRLHADGAAANRSSAGGPGSPSKVRSSNSLSRSSASSEGALTWEVPAILERTFGPTTEAVAETAPPAIPPAVLGVAQAPAGSAAGAANSAAKGSTPAGSISSSPTPSGSSGLHPLVQLNRQEFAVAAEQHLQLLLWQLLLAEDVEQADVWMPIVLRLVTEASKALLPAAAAAFGQQDPRFYVKVKRLPDMGRPSDSRVVRGVVAKKNVAHRRMRTDIQQPCVALLSGALEYQRVANKLSSFDTLLDQEREHLRLAVARIAAAKPDLLMVERSVARSAQEELLARGISLVQHTKPELLERLGRCMGVKVAASVEELSPQLVGTCSRFRVEPLPATNTPQQPQQQPAAPADITAAPPATTSALPASNGIATAGTGTDLAVTTAAAVGTASMLAPAGTAGNPLQSATTAHVPRPGVAKPLPVSATPAAAKTLMIFDGCPLPLGCTVLLWGGSAAELTKLKRIVKFGVLAAYHQGLECAFLAEELALGTTALASQDVSRDVSLFRSIARAAISSSQDATNPEHLPNSSRLLLSLSPHVVVPDALEKEQQHAAALRLYQQHYGATVQHQGHLEQQELVVPSQQQQQGASPPTQEPLYGLQEAPASTEGLEPSAPSGMVATTVAVSSGTEESENAPGTPGTVALLGSQHQQPFEPEFTDPLRRRTFPGDEDDLLSDDAAAAADLDAAMAGSDSVPKVAPLWLQGLQLYDRQHVYLSMACRNPRRGSMCEPPAIKRIDYYCHSDLSLAAFIVAAAPHAQKKCQVAGCGDGVTCHVRTFLHAGSRITLSIATLPANEALPGEDRGQVWMWMRPKGSRQRSTNSQAGVRRLPLSQACACMSFGMFLSLCFSAPGLEVFGTPLHAGFVRYFGLGRSVMCLHQDTIYPSSVVVPRVKISYSLNAQLMWLKQEAAELCQESNEAFDVLESALQSHPYFKSQAAPQQAPAPAVSPLAAAAALLLPGGTPRAASASCEVQPEVPAAATTASADDLTSTGEVEAAEGPGSDGSTPALSKQASAAVPAAAVNGQRGAPIVSLSAMLSAVRKDRSSFMDRVAEVVQRATPDTPTADGEGAHSSAGSSHVMWDEQLMSGVLELNRLQRSLAITTLTWAATLQEPALFTQMLAASSTAAGPAAMAAAAAATASAVAVPGSPLAAAALAAAAVAAELSEQGSGSAHGGSMFHLPPSVAAQRMGISDGSEAGDHSVGSSGVSVPIMPNAAGPIAVQAVANLVASEAATTTAGGLLEGSQQVMMAVAQRAAPELAAASIAGDSGRAGSLDEALSSAGSARGGGSSSRLGLHVGSSSMGSPRSPRARWAAAAAVAAAQAGSAARKLAGSLSAGARGSTGSLTGLISAASQDASTQAAVDTNVLSSSLPSSSFQLGGQAATAAGPGTLAISPSASLASSSLQSRQQQMQHRRAVSTTGSVGTVTASAAAAGSGDDGSSEDGEVSHDRFVAWMTSHEIVTPETDDMSDFYPEQLPDWDETIGIAAAIAAEDGGPIQAAAQAADRAPSSALRPPTPPGTPDWGRVDAVAAAPAAAAATAAAAGLPPQQPTHRRTGSTEAPQQQQQLQQQMQPGPPAGLAPIRTTPAGTGRGSSSANGSGGAVGLQQIARVALPGRALMPAGINDTVIPIFDAEPTSIAAYFLSSRAYQLQLNASMKQILHGEQRPGTQQGRQQQGSGSSSSDGPSSTGMAAAGGYQPLPTAAVPIAPPVNSHGRSISQDYTPGRSFVAFSPDDSVGSSSSAGRAVDLDPLRAGGTAIAQDRTTAAAIANGEAFSGTAAAGTAVGGSTTAGGSATQQQRQQQQQRGPNKGLNPKQPDWLALLLSPEPLHVKHAFEDDSPGMPWLRAKFSVTAYFAPQFAELRRRCIAGGEAAYITSLCRCRKWASRGGKSNAYFAKTRDDRFIVKSLSKPEKASFLEFAPAYFEHMAHAAASGKPTALAKVAGVYSITIRSQSGNPLGGQGPGGQAGPYKDGTIDVLVMENIFYDRQITRIYDLKGSERSRFNADAAANPQDVGAVHLDDNLRRANLQQPILVDQGMLRAMERALWSDTSFLAGLGVMDYSLLVGVDKEHNQLVVAIIDFIRTYTWDKQLETWVKSSGILGGNGKEPTIVSPKQYMRRFRTAISSYFTVVPDGHEVEPPLDADAA